MITAEQQHRLDKITYVAMQQALQINVDLEKYETCALLHQASLELKANIDLSNENTYSSTPSSS